MNLRELHEAAGLPKSLTVTATEFFELNQSLHPENRPIMVGPWEWSVNVPIHIKVEDAS